MFVKGNNREVTDTIVKYYENLSEGSKRFHKILFFVSPVIFYLLIELLNFMPVTKFLLMV